MCDKYNGYPNYETWVVSLWMSEATDILYSELCRDRIRKSEDIDEALYTLTRKIKEDCEHNMPELTGVFADLLNSAISKVDWHHIAKGIVEELLLKINNET